MNVYGRGGGGKERNDDDDGGNKSRGGKQNNCEWNGHGGMIVSEFIVSGMTTRME